ncbi:MAG: rod shape-determining protein MreC [Candidatus Midichloria sp.]|uniref:Cell shape-determining protein MreC n=1 Tax=Hyalomma marginatum TaxID=34627 RepID=A0A8S4C4R8_9ACAR|nr:rod shape-determining protein MreC [Hyalomma marginatum]CAG7592384.1 rod shape-determining protein MreC [Hyalomma marginatum]
MLKKPQIKFSKRSNIISLGTKARTVIVMTFSCLATIFFTLYFGEQSIEIFDDMISKVYQVANQPLDQVRNFIKLGNDYLTCKKEKDILVAENQNLKKHNLKIEILERENLELKKLNKYVASLKFQYVTTNIVSAGTDSFGLQIMLNAGAEDGVSEGQAVVNSEGIVGRVIKVSQKSSKLLPWSNVSFKVPVLLLKSGIHCIASGSTEDSYMSLLYLPENVEPIEGEMAVTSGEGGILPFGIKVGEIAVSDSEENEFILKPATNLNLCTMVAVVVRR